MEVKYNVKCSFKNCENKTNDEIKKLFNEKLLNIILVLENNQILSTQEG